MANVNPIENPELYLQTLKTKTKGLEEKSKGDGFSGEKGRLEDERNAELRHQERLKDFDVALKPALKKIEHLLTRNQNLIFVETHNTRLATFWEGKFFPFGRVGVNIDGDWEVSNDRDETERVGSASVALALLFGYIQPTIRANVRAKQAEAQRPAIHEAQEKYNRSQTAEPVHVARRARLT